MAKPTSDLLIGALESPGRLPDDGVSDFICATNRESESEKLSETETDSETEIDVESE